MRSSIRGLAEGALTTAIYFILLWLTLYAPILSSITGLVLSVPFIIIGSRHPAKVTLLTALSSILIAGLLTGISSALITIMFAAIGSVMGMSYRHYRSSWTALSFGFLTTIASYVLMLVIAYTFFHINAINLFKDYLHEVIDMSKTLSGGINSKQIETFEKSIDLFVMLLPALLMLAAMISTTISHLVGARILRRLGTAVQTLPPFKDWKLPRVLLFYYLITLILSFIPGLGEVKWIQTIVINSIYVLAILFTVQGLSFIAYYSSVKEMGKSPVVFAVIGIFLLGGFGFHFLISILGMVDLGFDIRGKVQRKK